MSKMTLQVSIVQDEDMNNPADDDCQWRPVSFSNSHINYADPDKFFPPDEELKEKLRVGLAFVLSYYEHGAGRWSLSGTGPQCEFDTVQVAGLLLWEHDTDDIGAATYEERSADAEGFLKDYSDWCNGWGYGYHVSEMMDIGDGELESQGKFESSWGYYAHDDEHMMKEIQSTINCYRQQHPELDVVVVNDPQSVLMFTDKQKETAS